MRTPSAPSLADALLGRTRAAVLAHAFSHPDEWFHLRQIARESGTSAGTAHRELQALVDIGLLLREPDGPTVRFKANVEHPVFSELQNLLAKTAGAFTLLRDRLVTLGDAVDVAFIYGSVARGEQKVGSDIDLMVVGSASLAGILKALAPVMETLRRDVNPTVYTAAEFSRKAKEGHSFVERVLSEPKIFLIGDARELGEPRKDRKTARTRTASRRNPAPATRAAAKPVRRKSRRP